MKNLIKGIILGIGGLFALIGMMVCASPRFADMMCDTVHAANGDVRKE